MTLPTNKFPFIPPRRDPDPGPPSVQLPPGVLPGPGPAPHAPFPLPVPPNDNGPPPPWPYYAPPDQVVPPYGRPAAGSTAGSRRATGARRPTVGSRCPQRRRRPGTPARRAGCAPAITTYDQNGKFVDPAGGTGVFTARR